MDLSSFLGDDLEPLLQAAKIKVPNLLPEVQLLTFANNYGVQDSMLMEITEDLLAQLENNDSFTMRGMTEDFTVLCTEDRTFEVKLREVSNVILVSPDIKTADLLDISCDRFVAQKQVTSMHSGYLELRPLVARCSRARHLLEESIFHGLDHDMDNPESEVYTMDGLLLVVQSSRAELQHYLNTVVFSAVIDGKIRLLSHDYVTRLMERVKNWLEENSLTWDEIPVGLASSALVDLEPENVLTNFFWPRFSTRSGNMMTLLRVPIARVYAATFLKRGGKIQVEKFIEWWRTVIPYDLDFEYRLLYGIAYQKEEDTLACFIYFPVEDLPTDPEARCRQLFHERNMWSKEELLHYVSDILLPGETAEHLLLKYAKTYVKDGVPFFVSFAQF